MFEDDDVEDFEGEKVETKTVNYYYMPVIWMEGERAKSNERTNEQTNDCPFNASNNG